MSQKATVNDYVAFDFITPEIVQKLYRLFSEVHSSGSVQREQRRIWLDRSRFPFNRFPKIITENTLIRYEVCNDGRKTFRCSETFWIVRVIVNGNIEIPVILERLRIENNINVRTIQTNAIQRILYVLRHPHHHHQFTDNDQFKYKL